MFNDWKLQETIPLLEENPLVFCSPSFSKLDADYFQVFSHACMGERGTSLFTGEPTLDEIRTSLKRQLVLTNREKVGVVIGAFTVSDRFVSFIYGLVAKMVRPHVVNRDAFIKNFSSLWKGKDVSIKEIA
ncbi:hypothetical protein ACE6H2_001728 [Prunus campanulata]